MYKNNTEYYYKLYDAFYGDFVEYFYSDDELIRFIAKEFRRVTQEDWLFSLSFSCPPPGFYSNFIKRCTCDKNQLSIEKDVRYILYDNYNRIINIQDFYAKALQYFKAELIDKKWWEIHSILEIVRRENPSRSRRYDFLKKMDLNYTYRKDPVPHTRKHRGGPSRRGPHTAKIKRMYDNPDYKYFNRGTFRGTPDWWDDKMRCVERSWKSQTKAKHQWEKNLK